VFLCLPKFTKETRNTMGDITSENMLFNVINNLQDCLEKRNTMKQNLTNSIKYLPIDSLHPYARNARTHSGEQIDRIAASIQEFGFLNPILIDSASKTIIAGHGRLLAAQRLGLDKVPTVAFAHLTDTQRRAYTLADNKLALEAGWDEELLKIELDELRLEDFELDVIGFDDFDFKPNLPVGDDGTDFNDGENRDKKNVLDKKQAKGSLAESFLIAPFSILRTDSGWWQNRKNLWKQFGIDSGKGRQDNIPRYSSFMLSIMSCLSGTSLFDPVLCEIAYRWFTPKNGHILDPFCGGSVRGIVASLLGRNYWGGDIRQEQIDANEIQWQEVKDKTDGPKPIWHCGDSLNIEKSYSSQADFIFSCPPYANLESYSYLENDISNMKYKDFKEIYKQIIIDSCNKLKNNRFACFVVGEIRDRKTGTYYNFVSDTIQAFLDAGLLYYNEIILVNSAGNLPLRVKPPFLKSRKIGKTHQNILVFVKGCPNLATQACGSIDLDFMEELESASENPDQK